MIKNQYGKAIDAILTSFGNKTSTAFDPKFLKENDYFVRFIRFQRQLYLGLSEEMKTKIVMSVSNTSKIISASNKQSLADCRKEVAEMETVMQERAKITKM